MAVISITACQTTTDLPPTPFSSEDKASFDKNVDSFRSLFLKGFELSDVEMQMSFFADSLKWSPPSYNGNNVLGYNDLKEVLTGYNNDFDNIKLLEGDGSIFGDPAGYWGGSFYSSGENGLTNGPNGLRIYGTWNSTHVESGATVNNKWYAVIFFNEDGKATAFSDWFDVNGMAVQIQNHLDSK